MSYTRYLPIPLVIVGIVVLTGALGLPPRPGAPFVPPGRQIDPVAERLLDQAMARYAPENIGWLETSVRQHICLAGLTFTAEGRHIQAPGNRLHTRLETCRGDTVAVWLAVSDGVHRWHRRRLGSGPWQELQDGQDGFALAGPASAGVLPLLRDLRRRLNWVGREASSNQRQTRLIGVWKPGVCATLAPQGQPWPDGLPNVCRLCLNTRTLWPTSIEWWGPSQADAAPTLLASIEFGTPVVGKALPPEDCSRLFTINSAD